MRGKFKLLGGEVPYSVVETRIIGDEFLARVIIGSWDQRDIERWAMNAENDCAVDTVCVPETESIWVKITKEKFKKLSGFALSEDGGK